MATVEIHVTLKPTLLDVQGATTLKALQQLGHNTVRDVRIGKYIVLEIDDADDLTLQEELNNMCRQLLANPVIEDYDISFVASTPATTPAAAPPVEAAGAPGASGMPGATGTV